MDADDILSLLNSLLDIAIYYMLFSFISAVTYGAAYIAFGLALVHLWRRIRSSRAVKILFVLITFQFLLLITNLVTIMVLYVGQLKSYHLYSASVPIEEQIVFPKSVLIATIINQITGSLSLLLGNAIIVWRAWVLYPSNRLVRLCLAGVWLCDVLLLLALMSIWLYTDTHSNSLTDSLMNRLQGTGTFLAFGVNTAATLSIAWKAWKHQLLLKSSSVMRSSRVVSILLILIEWGVTLCVTQLAIAILQVIFIDGDPANPRFIARSILGNCLEIFADTHPALIILVLARGRSVIDNSTFTGRSTGVQDTKERAQPHLTTLRFAEAHESGDASVPMVDISSIASEKDESKDGVVVA